MDIKNKENQIKLKMKEILDQEGIELVEFKLFFSNGRFILRCLVDYPTGGITVNDCAKLNTKIFNFIDTEKILGEDFLVEVSSPGLDRDLYNFKDFLRVKGKKICLWFDKDKYIEGDLISVTEESITLKKDDKIFEIDFGKIKLGRLKF